MLVTSYEGPLSEDEIVFLEKAIGSGVRRIFLVINKSDLVIPEEREKALEFLRGQCAEMRLGEFPIFSLSARGGLEAKNKRDAPALRRSGIRDLEDCLVSFLTHDKSTEFLARLLERTLALLSGSEQHSRIEGLLSRARELAYQVFSATGDAEIQRAEDRGLPVEAPDMPRPC